ncbi:MAG: putative rane-bound dehydrogenase [Planctomycetota bacterium]|nr:putative rane-bound dehydrogenase [Planctomycetota bacterium]
MRMTVLSRPLMATALMFALVATTRAQQPIPHAQDKPPGPALSPREAIKAMTVPEGFTVELVASEPDIINPVAMTFDEKGRVWITESLEYPRKDAGKGRDRVKILEDTDGDGKADKFTVFAEGLNIPSGIAVGHGGVWVANSPDLLFMQDTDGDGKADKTEVVVTGFGRDDTHELPNSLTWGPDGWLYGWNGVFNPASIKYRGKEHNFTCAIFRIHPKTREFEVWCEGTSNPWGIAFNENGDAFASACVIDHFWHLTESAYYHRQGGPYPPFTWKLESIVDFKHQKAAYCGVHYFDSPAYPEKYRGKFYMGNIHGNSINVDSVVKSGATYKAINQSDFLSANDAWFMPVVQKTGPDGSLYILDWYDRYHCYQDANRDPAGIDRLKGRLYRVRYKDTPRRANFDLSKNSDEQLIALLGSANVYDRDIAQRLLSERGKPVQEKLVAVATDGGKPRNQRLHAMWAMMGAGPIDLIPHRALLADADPTIRAFAVRAAGNMKTVDPAIAGTVKKLASDPDPTVRLQVAIAARKIDGVDAMPVLLEVLSRAGEDRITPAVVWQNLQPMLETGAIAFVEGSERYKEAGWIAGIYPRVIDRLLARRSPDVAPIATLLGRLLDGPQSDPEAASEAIGAMVAKVRSGEVAGARNEALRKAVSPLILQALAAQRPKLGQAGVNKGMSLLTLWKYEQALMASHETLAATRLPENVRLDAFSDLIAAGDSGATASAAKILSDPKAGSPEFRGKIITALGRLDDPRIAEVVLGVYSSLDPGTQPKAVELLTQRAIWSRALIDAVIAKTIPVSAVNVNQIRKLQATKDPALAKLVKSTFGIVREGRSPERDKTIARMKNLLNTTPGDPFAGQRVFAKVCGQCHKIYGEGQEVGPDLTGNGRNDFEQLLSNVFDPSLVIGAAYQATSVATADGRVLTGLLAEDNAQRIVLKVQGGKSEIIPRSQVAEMKVGSLSLMPEDVEKQLTDKEWADLFSFLTLDKPPSDPTGRRLPGANPR